MGAANSDRGVFADKLIKTRLHPILDRDTLAHLPIPLTPVRKKVGEMLALRSKRMRLGVPP
jgi:hypothetical protein